MCAVCGWEREDVVAREKNARTHANSLPRSSSRSRTCLTSASWNPSIWVSTHITPRFNAERASPVTHRQDRRARHRVSAPRESASNSTVARQAEPEAVLHADREAQQAMWLPGCYQAERHIASSTLRVGTETELRVGCQAGSLVDLLGCAGDEEMERTTASRGPGLFQACIWCTQWRERVNS